MLVYNKLKISGKFVEYSKFKKPLFVGKKTNKKKHFIRTKAQNAAFSLFRSSDKIFDLVKCNPELRYFVTYTFFVYGLKLSDYNHYLRIYLKRLRRRYPDIKYLGVPELQMKRLEKHNQFAIHYHFLFSKRLNYDQEISDWQQGFIIIKRLKGDAMMPAHYIAKYLTKAELSFIRLYKPEFKHIYYYSRNLKRPVKNYGFYASVLYNLMESEKKLSTLQFSIYQTKFLGEVQKINSLYCGSNISYFLNILPDLQNHYTYANVLPVVAKPLNIVNLRQLTLPMPRIGGKPPLTEQ